MIKAVRVTNANGDTLRIELKDPMKSGLAVREITGLGSPKLDINTTGFGTFDGSVVNSVLARTRNVTLTLIMVPRISIEDSRQLTYKYFQLKREITLTFELDNREVYIEGYVESNEPDIFSREETTQISIICPDPWFHELYLTETFFYGVIPLFEFPFSNESLTENLLEMSQINISNRQTIDYKGEVDTGMDISISIFGNSGDITIYNVDTRERIPIYSDRVRQITGQPLSKGDEVIISTVPGRRRVELLREGYYTNILGAMDKNADWLQLRPGQQSFTFTSSITNPEVIISMRYRNTYGAI